MYVFVLLIYDLFYHLDKTRGSFEPHQSVSVRNSLHANSSFVPDGIKTFKHQAVKINVPLTLSLRILCNGIMENTLFQVIFHSICSTSFHFTASKCVYNLRDASELALRAKTQVKNASRNAKSNESNYYNVIIYSRLKRKPALPPQLFLPWLRVSLKTNRLSPHCSSLLLAQWMLTAVKLLCGGRRGGSLAL